MLRPLSLSADFLRARRLRSAARVAPATGVSEIPAASPDRYFKPGEGFQFSKRVQRAMRALELVGLANSAWAVVNYDSFEADFQRFAQEARLAKSLTDPTQRQGQAMVAMLALRDYLKNLVPNEQNLNLITLGSLYKVLGGDDSVWAHDSFID